MFPGAQVTLASVSVPAYYMPLRIAGAQARKVLLDNVAAEWKVPVAELTTDKSMVIHAKSKRRISYGDVVKFAKVPDEPPKIAEGDLKKPSQFKLIGRKDIERVDVPSKVNGTAKYGIDVQVPGMVYASLLQAPMDGAKVDERQRRRRQEDQGRHPGAVAAVRRRGGGRHGRGDPRRPHTRSR